MHIQNMVGNSLTAVYTATEVSNNHLSVGMKFYDIARKAWFIFLKNSGAAAITQKLACVALGTDKSSYFAALAAATDAVIGFAGVRVADADSMAQGEYGWFQYTGAATFLHSGGQATAANEYIVTSATVAGKVEGGAPTVNTVASLAAGFALCEAAKTTLDEEVKANIVRSVWGFA